MISAKQFLALVVLCNAICAAQIRPYTGVAIGVSGSGYTSPFFDANTGLDADLRPLFVEAEVGADTANKQDTRDGYTVKAHGLLMLRVASGWHLGGGVRYSELTTSLYKKHDRWPVAAVMFQRKWFRGNVEYLAPGSDHRYHLTGALLDLRIRLARGIYYRERVSGFVYRNPFEANPSYHKGSDLDYGLIYVFNDRPRSGN
jgi:hypothetical protein